MALEKLLKNFEGEGIWHNTNGETYEEVTIMDVFHDNNEANVKVSPSLSVGS